MWSFWLIVALLAAGAAALILARAGAAARRAQAGAEDPALPVYRRQLSELDAQAAEGRLDPEAHRAARAEAGRRLLRFAERGARDGERPGGGRSRLAVLAVACVVAALALGVYLKLGAPGDRDKPYATRLARWREADPATLDAPQMVAVLRAIARAHPHDARAQDYLGRAEFAAGDPFEAARAFAAAAALAPQRAGLYAAEAQALVVDAGGKVTPQAKALFETAIRLDPKDNASRYFLGRAEIAAGDRAAGVAAWKALAADLAPNDPHRPALLAEIAMAQGGAPPAGVAAANTAALAAASATGGAPSAATRAALLAGPQAGFIQAMVARQASELQAKPDNPAGWARLVRAYGVLGDRAAQAQALARARQLFAGRPADLKPIEAEATAAPAG